MGLTVAERILLIAAMGFGVVVPIGFALFVLWSWSTEAHHARSSDPSRRDTARLAASFPPSDALGQRTDWRSVRGNSPKHATTKLVCELYRPQPPEHWE